MKTLTRLLVGVFILTTVLFLSCKKPRSNPVDPGGTAYKPPSVEIISGPAEGSTISSNTVTFAWRGNTNANLFRYRLVGKTDNWSNWSKDTTAKFSYLDDGSYRFEVETMYEGQPDRTGSASRSFNVDAIIGPAVKFHPLYVETNAGGVFTVEIWIDDLQNLFTGSLTVSFDQNLLELLSVSAGDMVSANNFTLAIVPDFSKQAVLDKANNTGQLELNFALLSSQSGNETLSGTGSIIKLEFRAKDVGQSQLNIASATLLDYNGNEIQLNTTAGGVVVIK